MDLDFFLETLDGRREKLKHPLEFSCIASADTPADSLKAVFFIESARKWQDEIVQIEVQGNGKRLFHGICDRQIISLDSDGCRLTIWGRSDAAALLDNEAIPREYSHISLEEMFQRHIQPYGFQNELGFSAVLSDYRIGKGVSEWDAFSAFCLRAVGIPPYIYRNKVSFLTNGRGKRVIVPTMTVQKISRTLRRSEIISEVLIRDDLGRYSGRAVNETGQALRIERRRCMLPSAQWAQTAVDAELKMKQSLRGHIRLEIRLAQMLDWQLGEEVILPEQEGFAYFRGNIIRTELRFSQGGCFTHLTLE